MAVFEVISQSLTITVFVFMMMLMVEYINVFTKGRWREKLSEDRFGQYLLAGFLGALPGCFGVFLVVTLFTHRIVRLGALVAAAIASSGDEAFVMFALIPRRALGLTLLLFFLGILAGWITDLLSREKGKSGMEECDGFQFHTAEESGHFDLRRIAGEWKHCSPTRAIFSISLTLLVTGILIKGWIEPVSLDWEGFAFLVLALASLFIAATVPDHFLKEHLWDHIAKQHLPRIFGWVLGTLLLFHFLSTLSNLPDWALRNQWFLLAFACLIGLVPESGPHLIFLTLYTRDLVPMSILFASSIVQDGHGLLPLLAHSKRDFLIVKLVNLSWGLLLGATALYFGH